MRVFFHLQHIANEISLFLLFFYRWVFHRICKRSIVCLSARLVVHPRVCHIDKFDYKLTIAEAINNCLSQ